MTFSFFRRIIKFKNKIKIPKIYAQHIDPFYSDFNIEEVALYQIHFNQIINNIDINNYTLWSMSKIYDKEKFKLEEDIMYNLLIESQKDGINGAILQNMINQYIFADILAREIDKSIWVKTVLFRKPMDYFPDASRTRKLLEIISI